MLTDRREQLFCVVVLFQLIACVEDVGLVHVVSASNFLKHLGFNE